MRNKGFTLIEMLVVIMIIGLLAVFLLPNVLGAQEAANQLADQKNLQEIFQFHQLYRNKKSGSPPHGGHRFLLAPWVDHIIEKSELNRDRYFTPGKAGDDPYYQELRKIPIEELWRRYDDLSSMDTHYAGLQKQHLRLVTREGTPLAATDNEGIQIWNDGTIHVLMSNGSVKKLAKDELIADHGWPADAGKEYVYPVGADSPHPLLKMLEQ